MKLLFDQNLSRKLPRRLTDLFPGSGHVHDLHLDLTDDSVVWQYACDKGLAIVTKDDDFRDRSLRLGHPPKVVWLHAGNCTTARIESLLRDRCSDLLAFDADPSRSLLTLP